MFYLSYIFFAFTFLVLGFGAGVYFMYRKAVKYLSEYMIMLNNAANYCDDNKGKKVEISLDWLSEITGASIAAFGGKKDDNSN